MDKPKLMDYIELGLSSYQIATRENLGAATVRYWLRKHGLKTKCAYKRGGQKLVQYEGGLIWTTPKEELQAIINACVSIKQVIERLGLLICVYQYRAFRKRVQADNLDISPLSKSLPKNRYPAEAIAATTVPVQELLREEVTVDTKTLKQKLLKAGLLRPVCNECDNDGIWRGQPLVLQLDHINGLRTDNRLENLQLLCPNCHSQTKTWGNKRREPS